MPAKAFEDRGDHERHDRHHHADVAGARDADALEQREVAGEGDDRAEEGEVKSFRIHH